MEIDITLPEKAELSWDDLVKPSARGGIRIDGDSKKGDVVEYLHFDDTGGTFTHEMRQNVEPALEWVKKQHLQQGSSVGKSETGEWYHAARVPAVVIHAWLNKRGLKMCDFRGKIIDEFLNDSDNSYFRVWKGHC